jgi:hypothetical protein
MPKDVFGRWEIPSYALIDFLQRGDTIYKPKDKDSFVIMPLIVTVCIYYLVRYMYFLV